MGSCCKKPQQTNYDQQPIVAPLGLVNKPQIVQNIGMQSNPMSNVSIPQQQTMNMSQQPIQMQNTQVQAPQINYLQPQVSQMQRPLNSSRIQMNQINMAPQPQINYLPVQNSQIVNRSQF